MERKLQAGTRTELWGKGSITRPNRKFSQSAEKQVATIGHSFPCLWEGLILLKEKCHCSHPVPPRCVILRGAPWCGSPRCGPSSSNSATELCTLVTLLILPNLTSIIFKMKWLEVVRWLRRLKCCCQAWSPEFAPGIHMAEGEYRLCCLPTHKLCECACRHSNK